jgi:hypothetical protein
MNFGTNLPAVNDITERTGITLTLYKHGKGHIASIEIIGPLADDGKPVTRERLYNWCIDMLKSAIASEDTATVTILGVS